MKDQLSFIENPIAENKWDVLHQKEMSDHPIPFNWPKGWC